MSDGFRVPEDIIVRIEELFPESEERRKIAHTMMHWRERPTQSSLKKIGAEAGRSVTTARKVLHRLMEEGLMTNEFGSVPLFKYNERHRISGGGEGERAKRDEEGEFIEGASEITIERAPQLPQGPVVKGVEVDPPGVKDLEPVFLERRISSLEADLRGVTSTMRNGFGQLTKLIEENKTVRVVNPVSVETPSGNPGANPPHPPEPVVEETLEERLDRIELLLEQGGRRPVDPFDGLDREQIISLFRDDPRGVLTLANPEVAGQEGRVQAQEVTLRPMILMLTTYSQMLFEKAIFDGYFNGTLSDFVNFTIEQYFIDRGYSLDWTKREPAKMGDRRYG